MGCGLLFSPCRPRPPQDKGIVPSMPAIVTELAEDSFPSVEDGSYCSSAGATNRVTPKDVVSQERVEQMAFLKSAVADGERDRSALKHVTIGDTEARELSPVDVHGTSPPEVCRQSKDDSGTSANSPKRRAQQEQCRITAELAERPSWGSSLAPLERGEWNSRHKNVYCNDGANLNTRSYFDRWLDARTPDVSERLGAVKPSWRLEPDGVSCEERRATSKVLRSYFPRNYAPMSRATKRKKTPRREAPPIPWERPWETPPILLDDDHVHKYFPLPGGGGSAGVELTPPEKQKDYILKKTVKENEVAAAKWHEASAAGTFAPEDVECWDKFHASLWCNEQTVGNVTKLIPSHFRSYFDRWREPDAGARSQARRPMRKDGTGEEISRMIPVWTLDPIPGTDDVPDPTELKVQRSLLIPGTGTGGDPDMTAAKGRAMSKSMSLPSRLGPLTALDERREFRWQSRHEVVFKNEEVSRLERSYFDRFREPACMFYSDTKTQAKSRGSVRIWSLEASEGPRETASKVTAQSERRFKTDGKWNQRHHLTFYNKIHPNARSYFERNRNRPDESADPENLIMADPRDSTDRPHRDPTASTERRQRNKLEEDEKLLVKWSLQEPSGPVQREMIANYLRSDTAQNLRERETNRRREKTWFSSHGMVF